MLAPWGKYLSGESPGPPWGWPGGQNYREVVGISDRGCIFGV